MKPELNKIAINLLINSKQSKLDTSSQAFRDISKFVLTLDSFEALQVISDNFDYDIRHVFINADTDLDKFKQFVLKSARPDKHIEFDLFDTQESVSKIYLNNLLTKRHLNAKLFKLPLNPFTLRLVIGADAEFVNSFGQNIIYSMPRVTDFALGLKESKKTKSVKKAEQAKKFGTTAKESKKGMKKETDKTIKQSVAKEEVTAEKEAPMKLKVNDKFKKSAKKIQDIDAKPAVEESVSQKPVNKSTDKFKRKPHTDKFKKKRPKKVQDVDVNFKPDDVKKPEKSAAKSQEINILPDIEESSMPEPKAVKKKSAKLQAKSQEIDLGDMDLNITPQEETKKDNKQQKVQDVDLAIDSMDMSDLM